PNDFRSQTVYHETQYDTTAGEPTAEILHGANPDTGAGNKNSQNICWSGLNDTFKGLLRYSLDSDGNSTVYDYYSSGSTDGRFGDLKSVTLYPASIGNPPVVGPNTLYLSTTTNTY